MEKKTVRVRIAVAVNSNGDWNAYGYKFRGKAQSDEDAFAMAIEGLDSVLGANEFVHFIEADVEIPEAKTIQGEVVK